MERQPDVIQLAQSLLHDTLDGQTKAVIGLLNNQLFSDIRFKSTLFFAEKARYILRERAQHILLGD
ncbi:MAG: hypothetical protein WBP54_03215 [Pelodictyon phaeoclathratiforme]